jgi:type 1 glutamine amidotransferase
MRKLRLAVIGIAVGVGGFFALRDTPHAQAGGPAPAAAEAPGTPAPAAGQAPAAGRQGGARAGGQGRQGGGGGGRGAQQRPRKVLLAWADTRNGQAQHAFTSHALSIVERLGYESGLWDTFIRTDSHIIYNQAQKTDGTPASGGPSLGSVDGIFFLGHREVPLNDQQKKELLDWVRSGKGFVAAHTGLTAFGSWPEFGEMIGATYGGHPIDGPGRVIKEQPSFPAVRHFPATFAFEDEFYLPTKLSREKVDVLLRLDTSESTHPNVAKGSDYPIVWTKMYGQGRVFYGSLSHDATTWDMRSVQLMYLEAIKWSLGLTDAPVQPHPMRDAPTAPAPAAAPAPASEGN